VASSSSEPMSGRSAAAAAGFEGARSAASPTGRGSDWMRWSSARCRPGRVHLPIVQIR
jgi:hypothetical protein